MRWPGIYRLVPEGEIILGHYDYEKKQLGPYKFDSIYGFAPNLTIENIEDLLQERFDFMYKAMLTSKKLLAVVFINNEFYLKVYPSSLEMYNYDGDAEVSKLTSIDHITEELVPVGFIKTYVKSFKVLITPQRIFYSPKRKSILVGETWIEMKESPAEWKGLSLYKELVKTDFDYVIHLADGTNKYFRKEK